MDECAHQHKVRGQQTYRSRFRSDRRKEYVLTRGDLGIDSFSMSQEVSRGHSSREQRARPNWITWRSHNPVKDRTLNVSNEARSLMVACLQTRNKEN